MYNETEAKHETRLLSRAPPLFARRMLIGAPLDQNKQPGTNRSGALWQCPMTTDTRDCEQIITDGRISE